MHELSVCQALIAEVESLARTRGASGVGEVTLRIGLLSGVEPELLARAFPLACTGRLTENATLKIETVAPRIRCRECGGENEVPSNRLLCAACGGWRVDVIDGDELLLARVELNGVSRPASAIEQPGIEEPGIKEPGTEESGVDEHV